MLKEHPKGLAVLFFANMGERFGFYTMLSIFILYLQENFGWDDDTAGNVYGGFLFAIYFMPLLGGFLSDRVLGYGKTVALGTVIMAAGYALLAVPTDSQWMVYAALGVISLGNGMFKGNLAVIVGNLYESKEKASLRDAAFNIYYMGINIGAFFAPYAANLTKNYVHSDLGLTFAQGYNAAFAVAGAGMIVSLLIFLLFRKHYAHADYRSGDKKAKAGAAEEVQLTPKQYRDRVVALLIVFSIVIFFWMAFHQNGFTLTLFAKNYTVDHVDPLTFMFFDLAAFLSVIAIVLGLIFVVRSGPVWARFVGVALALAGAVVAYFKYTSFSASNEISAELFQSFNPIFIVFITPLVVGVFGWLKGKGKEPSSPGKIGIGMLVTAIGFTIMVIASQGMPSPAELDGGRSELVRGPYWLISAYFTLTIAELFLSPMGLSFVSKVSPPKLRGLMQGGWLGATAIGNLAAGLIGNLYARWELWQFFAMLVGFALLSSLALAVLLKKLKAATA